MVISRGCIGVDICWVIKPPNGVLVFVTRRSSGESIVAFHMYVACHLSVLPPQLCILSVDVICFVGAQTDQGQC